MNAPHPWLAASQNLQAPLVVNRANVSDISSNSANDGHHYIAELSARFICHLFCCVAARTKTDMPLPSFISAVLQRIRVHSNVPYVALVLLQRLKARFPQARGSSGHRLFLSTLMIASKMVCDASFSNLSWSIAAQNIFPLREINAMERHMCNLLDWELNVDSRILRNFQAMVRQDFSSWSKRPYPTYSLATVSRRAAPADASRFLPPGLVSNMIRLADGLPHGPILVVPPYRGSPAPPAPTPSASSSPAASTSSTCAESSPSSASPQTPHESSGSHHQDCCIGLLASPSTRTTGLYAKAVPALW
ncbi:hypothetical protein R3P38DRAFT_912005 [Favolaschia claudopus]|uniref:Cyclin N-terminal domain-containing protein n=1 Tax=Favolaschia claudopus TaxID=2862362 RepID=A0AAW0BRM0_9AGAR